MTTAFTPARIAELRALAVTVNSSLNLDVLVGAALPAALDEIERLRAENEKLREALTKIVCTEVTGLGDTLVAVLRECRSIARRALEGGAS